MCLKSNQQKIDCCLRPATSRRYCLAWLGGSRTFSNQFMSDTFFSCLRLRLRLMYQHESGLFNFRRIESSPLLLVIDRRDDPVTPMRQSFCRVTDRSSPQLTQSL
ncbi:hypothetical protein F2Q70_00044472 [Brassica cretica]|uniref:Uncharacterized protein n=1 Tax=Brassica cretica TaxID=69181 RepID=A0A8S9KID3_BRACR|nr:hypothetical protein F2Q70_00044472 [Brassica cretica]